MNIRLFKLISSHYWQSNKDEKVFLQETEIDLENLIPRLIAISANKSDIKIFIRADKILSYGKVIEIMGMINSAGFTKIALVTDFPKPKLKPKLKKNK